MSNELVAWKEELAEEAKKVAELYRPSVGRISFKSGIMSYQGNMIPGNKITVVVLDAVFERDFYKDRYDPNKLVNPTCFALSPTPEGMVPHDSVPEKQADVCESCKYNQWGSDLQGRKGKACKEVVKLILLPVATLNSPEDVSKAELAICKIPVTSVKNWGNYCNRIAGLFGLPPYAVITDVTLVPDQSSQFKITFTEKGPVESKDHIIAIRQRLSAARSILMTPYDYTKEVEGAVEEEQTRDATKKKKY